MIILFPLYVAFFGIYILLAGWLTDWAARKARARGIAGWKWRLPMALVMYHLVFWDWVPTVVAHKYYCSKYGGFTVYKTLEEWKMENPGVMARLVSSKDSSSQYEENHNGGYKKIREKHLNKRFNVVEIQQDMFIVLPIIRRKEELKDITTGEILAQYIGFSTGNSVKNTISPLGGPLKLWMSSAYCSGGRDVAIRSRIWMNQFKGKELR